MAYIGKTPVIGNFVKLDAITAVNGQAAYTMQNGGSNFTDYESVNQFLVSLNGTIQAPTDSFTVSGSTLTFASNLSTGDVINFVIVFGNSLSAGTPTDGTVTNAKLSSGSFSNITGTGTLTNFASTGIDDNGDQTVITIDNQERVGIRETSPISELHITDSSATAVVRLESSDTGDCRINFDDQSATDRGRIIYAHSDDSLRTEVAGSERMRINANGNIMIGNTTESARLHISSSTSAGTDPLIVFSDSGGTDCGSIDLNATANTVAYTTSSDYRLKENVSYDFDATTRLKQLKPARFNFIADADTTVDGFLAHEVQSVVPEAISGEKDAVKEDGTPDYQGIDQSKLVPLLVKTIQELEARITELENA